MVFSGSSYSRRAIVWGVFFVCLTGALMLSFLVVDYLERSARTFAQAPSVNPDFTHPTFDKTIALTFDDGPDPTFTIPIARYLESMNVTATFFLIGERVLEHPHIARFLVERGFEIGNHSFSHAHSVHESSERIRKELVTTDLALVYATGHSTTIYRPPFLLDIKFGTPNGREIENHALRIIESVGPMVVGADIDTTDWEKESIYEEDEIYRILLAGAKAGKHVVLLHDHGGHGATLAALKRFVPQMLEQGYTFVPISHYYGLSRDEVMPPATLSLQQYGLIGFLYVVSTNSFLATFLITVAILSLLRITLILGSMRALSFLPSTTPSPSSFRFAVVIPAYNEEANIRATLRSVSESTMPPSRVIVVDDGSDDRTAAIVRSFTHSSRFPIELLQKTNGGTKAGALQHALRHVHEEIVICIDADTVVDRRAFEHLLPHFSNDLVGAVAGKVYPATTKTWVEKMQYLEYIQGQNLDKRVFALWNSVGIVPGAIGAWRMRALTEVGGYSTDTVVEDQDLTLALLVAGWNINYETHALAYTETPATLQSFFNQRFRWMYGTLQCFYKYDVWLFSPKKPWLGLIVLPNILFFNIIFPIAAPIIDLVAVLGIFGFANAPLIVASFLIFVVLDMWLVWEGMRHEKSPRYSLLLWVPVQRMVYHFLLAFAIIKSMKVALSGSMVKWQALARRGAAAEALSHERPPEEITEFAPQA